MNCPILFSDPDGEIPFVNITIMDGGGKRKAPPPTDDDNSESMNMVGTAASVNAETVVDRDYYFFFTIEHGIGYNKSFGNNSIITLFTSTSADLGNGCPLSAGIDINQNGYGAAIEVGTNVAYSFHLNGNGDSLERGWDAAGHSYMKLTCFSDDGVASYAKISMNLHEVGATVLACCFAPQAIPSLVYAFATIAEIVAP